MSDFFDAIKKNWKQALVIGIINLAITVIMILAMLFYYENWNVADPMWNIFFKIGLVVSGCAFIVFSFLKYYINILIVTFDLKIKQLYKNSLLLSSAGLKQNIIISLALIPLYGVLVVFPAVWALFLEEPLLPLIFIILAVLFLPAIQSLITQFCVFPVVKKHMIDPYYEQHPEAKKDKALLNLEDEEDDEASEEVNEEVIFKDRGTQETPPQKTESTIPKQYSKRDIKRIRRQRDSEDDTI